MIKLIVGAKGSGKTKMMIEMINEAAQEASGCIVCIEKGMKSTYNVKNSVRIIDADDYAIRGYNMFYGFFMGILAGNYDIQEVYVDGILKIGDNDVAGFAVMLDQIEELCKENLKVVFTVSTDPDNLSEEIKKYL
ncbi:MAG: ATP-binding protein [Oscillospiraceae bacterium]